MILESPFQLNILCDLPSLLGFYRVTIKAFSLMSGLATLPHILPPGDAWLRNAWNPRTGNKHPHLAGRRPAGGQTRTSRRLEPS